jgi:AcrR family transcriptional regulator
VSRESPSSLTPRAVPPSSSEPAPARIVDAAIRRIVSDGVSGASMAAIAAEAGVSKALLHYHYADRARLLAEVVSAIADRVIAREQGSLRGVDGRDAVNVLWHWVESELALGELHALLELASLRDPPVRAASTAAAERRRAATTRTTADLFARLGAMPRVPAALLGSASVAFVDGLAHDRTRPPHEVRGSFDVFWLALLGLAG